MEEDIKILEKDITYNKRQIEEIGSYIPFDIKLMERVENLIKRYQLLEHRLEVADEFIEIRKKNMIPEHYDDLKYIINECDLNSSW